MKRDQEQEGVQVVTITRFDEAPHALVQIFSQRIRQIIVGHLLRQDMLE